MEWLEVDGVNYAYITLEVNEMMLKKEVTSFNICGLSQKSFQLGDTILSFMNAGKTFPNKSVLQEEVEKRGMEESIRYLAKRYQEYKEMKEKYIEWNY